MNELSGKYQYPGCQTDLDCGQAQFCGIECWMGGCGADRKVSQFTMGQFCQPCDECQGGDDAVSGSCKVVQLFVRIKIDKHPQYS